MHVRVVQLIAVVNAVIVAANLVQIVVVIVVAPVVVVHQQLHSLKTLKLN